MDATVTNPDRLDALDAISGSTKLYPVIGHPVAQVRAPAVFNRLFRQAGMNAMCIPLDLPAHHVAAACQALLASDSIGGILVTVPYKKTLAQVAESLGPAANHVGAVNALRRGPAGRVEGDLFDGLGFVRGLHAAGHRIAGRRIMLLGAGGAGAAIAAALAEAGVAELAIYDPDRSSLNSLAARLQPLFPATRMVPLAAPKPAGCDIVVQASPLGLQSTDPLPLDPSGLAPGTLVCDIIMKPHTTAFLQGAIDRGLPVHRGQHMLDHQIPAYLAFFGLQDLARRVRVAGDAFMLEPAG